MIYRIKIRSYSEITGQEETEYILATAESYIDCLKQIVDAYGDGEILQISMSCISPDKYITFDSNHKQLFNQLANGIETDAIW